MKNISYHLNLKFYHYRRKYFCFLLVVSRRNIWNSSTDLCKMIAGKDNLQWLRLITPWPLVRKPNYTDWALRLIYMQNVNVSVEPQVRYPDGKISKKYDWCQHMRPCRRKCSTRTQADNNSTVKEFASENTFFRANFKTEIQQSKNFLLN